MILDIEFRIIIDDEQLKEYLQYRVYTRNPGKGESWSDWKTVKHYLGAKPKDLEKIFYA